MSKRFYQVLYELKSLRRLVPSWLKEFIRTYFPIWSYKYLRFRFAQSDPYPDDNEFVADKGRYPYILGIIKEFGHSHQHYIAACRELDVSYKVLDITGSDWIEVIRNSQCDAFLVWPSPIMTIWKQMYDERLKVMVDDLGKIIFPSYDELWFWESKRRMRDWLVAHDVPHPPTWIFYDLNEAREFLDTAQFPIVFKLDFGDCSKGVRILRSKKEALGLIKRVFTKGIRLPDAHPLDIQWGSVVFQKYIPNAIEWRIIRIGESYLGHRKKRIGDYASGLGIAIYEDLPRSLLNLTRQLTDTYNLMSMSLDILVEPEGQAFIIELQSLYGGITDPKRSITDGNIGRYLHNESKQAWEYEEGIFDQNMWCNLRVQHICQMLAGRRGRSDTDSSSIAEQAGTSQV